MIQEHIINKQNERRNRIPKIADSIKRNVNNGSKKTRISQENQRTQYRQFQKSESRKCLKV